MQRLAETAEAIGATTKKTEKVRILAEYLRSLPVDDAARAAVFLSGRPFPAWEETTLQVGGALLVRVILEVAGKREAALENAYRKTGDLGAAACELLGGTTDPSVAPKNAALPQDDNYKGPETAALPQDDNHKQDKFSETGLTLAQVERGFREIAAARGPAAKAALLRRMLERAMPLEAKYLIKIVTSELRIGLKQNLVEETIAAAFGAPLADVQRANMLLGDVGETLRRASEHRLSAARMRMFHPLGFMLASPVETITSPPSSQKQGGRVGQPQFETVTSPHSFQRQGGRVKQPFEFAHAQIEDKYDGIRAQAHAAGGEVRLFSRTLDDVTESFPELVEPLAAFEGVILDGEVVAWDFDGGHALPFSELQKRLGRKKVTAAMIKPAPVAYVVFDVLYADGELVIDRPLRERGELLERIFKDSAARRRTAARGGHVAAHDAQGKLAFEPAVISDEDETHEAAAVVRAPVLRAESPADLEELFARAQARGNEGLMIKDPDSPYQPGRRGRSWVKLKRELATLDVVVTSVEWGHGKRIGVLSDYTFAVREPDGTSDPALPRTAAGDVLLNVGKAYSGLTDREIAEMTEWFVEHTKADHGFWREVEPQIVIEVAFNAVMRSDRHNSGYALRFPRILRLRPDKTPEQADTLDRVREIYELQKLAKIA